MDEILILYLSLLLIIIIVIIFTIVMSNRVNKIDDSLNLYEKSSSIKITLSNFLKENNLKGIKDDIQQIINVEHFLNLFSNKFVRLSWNADMSVPIFQGNSGEANSEWQMFPDNTCKFIVFAFLTSSDLTTYNSGNQPFFITTDGSLSYRYPADYNSLTNKNLFTLRPDITIADYAKHITSVPTKKPEYNYVISADTGAKLYFSVTGPVPVV